MPCRTHVDLDLQRWDCREVSHAHQVVGCAGEAEDPVHFAHSAMPHFAQQGDRLQPAETLFDALSLLLTETIAGMLCRAPVDCAPTAPCQVLRHMGRHSQMSTLGPEIPSVEALISAYGHRLRSRNLLQHHQRRIALCPSVGHEHFCGDDQSVAILDQQIPAVAQLGLLPITFARQLRLGIGLRCMRLIRPPLAAKAHRGIAGIVRRRRRLSLFRLKALETRPGSSNVPSTVKCSLEVRPWARACSTTCARNCLATSASSNRSRFLVKLVASQTSSSKFNPTNHGPDGAQRMIFPHSHLRRQITEHVVLLMICSSHTFSYHSRRGMRSSFSAAC